MSNVYDFPYGRAVDERLTRLVRPVETDRCCTLKVPEAVLAVRSILILEGHTYCALVTVDLGGILLGPLPVYEHGTLLDPLVDAGHPGGVQGWFEAGALGDALSALVRREYVLHRLAETPALRISVWPSLCDAQQDGDLLTTFDLTYRGHSFTQFPITRSRTGAHGCDVELPEFQGTVLAGLDDWMVEVAVKAAFAEVLRSQAHA